MAGCAGSLLTAGSARAAITICDFGGFAGGNTPCATSGAGSILDLGDKQVKLTSLPTVGKGTINFQNLVADLFTVRTFFQPALSLPPFSGATFTYDIEIISGSQTFLGAKLAADAVQNTDITTTETSSPSRFAQLDIVNSISPDPPSTYEPMIAPGLTKLSIRNVYSVGTASGLTSFTNTFQQTEVPGPLPIVGAGMAFGFSRRLRSRIRSGTSA